MVAVFSFWACNDEEDLLKGNDPITATEMSSRSDFNLNHPVEDGEVYSFQDTGHFFSYYDELRALYDYDLQTFDSVVYDGRTIPYGVQQNSF